MAAYKLNGIPIHLLLNVFVNHSATHRIACNTNMHTCMRNTTTSIICAVIHLHSYVRLFHSLPFPSLTHTCMPSIRCTNKQMPLCNTLTRPNEWERQRIQQNSTISTYRVSHIFQLWHILLHILSTCMRISLSLAVCESVPLRTLQRKEEEKEILFSVTSVAYAFSLLSRSEYRVLCVQFCSLFFFIILTIKIVQFVIEPSGDWIGLDWI